MEGHLAQGHPEFPHDVSLEFGYGNKEGGYGGTNLFVSYLRQHEVVPEWLWLNAVFGLGLTGGTGDVRTAGFESLGGTGLMVASPWGLRLTVVAGCSSTSPLADPWPWGLEWGCGPSWA